MEIKEAILKEEMDKVKSFLDFFNLDYSKEHLDKTFYIEDNSKVIGTISHEGSIIKCLAVSESYQGENLSSMLISHIISYLSSINIHSYTVYTKPEYEETFKSFGFKRIVGTNNTILLEGGAESINDSIKGIKVQIEMDYGSINEDSNIGALVFNANPFTTGHEMLIEEASSNHDLVLLFIVEEDKSFFSFKERFSMAYLSTRRFKNVIVIPSTRYIVSLLTFPSYFLKSDDLVTKEYALIDALIFKDYFMKNLYIKKRYVGSESKDYMNIYNETLKEVLGDSLVLIDRYKDDDGDIISASKVRELIKEKRVLEAYKYVPKEIDFIILGKSYE